MAALVLALPGCDVAGGTTGAETSIAGTYSVQTVDGHPLPYTLNSQVLTAASLLLKTDNTWSVTFTSHFTAGGDSSESNNGTYTYSNNDLALKSALDASVSHGSFSGTTLTVNGDDGVYVLKKN